MNKVIDLLTDKESEVTKIIDSLQLPPLQKRELEMKLMMAFYEKMEKEVELRANLVVQEMKGNWLQRSWRPIVMVAMAGVVVAGAFIDIPMLKEDSPFWEVLKVGVGGYVVGRGVERISEKVLRPKWRR